jgi:hypothetical protein
MRLRRHLQTKTPPVEVEIAQGQRGDRIARAARDAEEILVAGADDHVDGVLLETFVEAVGAAGGAGEGEEGVVVCVG